VKASKGTSEGFNSSLLKSTNRFFCYCFWCT